MAAGDVMASVQALAWLANLLARRGRPARRRVRVHGSVVETKWLNRGDSVVMTIEGLGRGGGVSPEQCVLKAHAFTV